MANAPQPPKPLVLRRHEDLVTLQLNRPERRNALSRELVLSLGEALEDLGRDDSVRVIVLTGAGGAFCSGADLSTIHGVDPTEIPQRIEEFHRVIRGIVHAPQPVLAAVSGGAVGFGADLALACDLRVMATDAYLQESFVHIGLMPDGGGTFWAPHAFGGRAFEILALGNRLAAEECQRLNVASLVVSPDELEARVGELARALAQKPTLALRQIKAALREPQREGLAKALALEKAGQVQLLASADFEEGVRAFLAKRTPLFSRTSNESEE